MCAYILSPSPRSCRLRVQLTEELKDEFSPPLAKIMNPPLLVERTNSFLPTHDDVPVPY